jgi:cytochrome c5
MLVFLLALIIACEKSNTDVSVNDQFAEFDQLRLRRGRTIWIENCKACHASGIAGAPAVSNRQAWLPRLQQGNEILYQHALNGFYGPDYAFMPPRGGNEQLSDTEVVSAVDYMIAIVSFK